MTLKASEISEVLNFEAPTEALGNFKNFRDAMSFINSSQVAKRNELFDNAGINKAERYIFQLDFTTNNQNIKIKDWWTYPWNQNQQPVYRANDGIYLDKSVGRYTNHHSLNFRFGLFNFIINLSDIYKLESSESKLLIKFTS